MPLLLTAAALPALVLGPVSIDGDFDDWSGLPVLTTDAAGDASGGFDVTRVKATGAGSVLAVQFDVGQDLNYQSGAGSQGTLLVRLAIHGGPVVELDCRDRAFTVGGSSVPWTAVDFAGAPTFADDEFEMRFDLATWGVGPGSQVDVSFAGSDTVAPVTVTMGAASSPPAER
ncbi:MAG: hypothetical protein KDA21_07805, partial [Phycisphaerales bacterium]|nr:hypothetical protein [Phycisphaerales bacterium]